MHVNSNTVKKPNSIQTTKTAFALYTFIILLIGAGAGFGLHFLFANFVKRPVQDQFPVKNSKNSDSDLNLPSLIIPDPDAKPEHVYNPCENLECYKNPTHPDSEKFVNETVRHIWHPASWLKKSRFSKKVEKIKSDTNYLRWHCRVDYRNIVGFKPGSILVRVQRLHRTEQHSEFSLLF